MTLNFTPVGTAYAAASARWLPSFFTDLAQSPCMMNQLRILYCELKSPALSFPTSAVTPLRALNELRQLTLYDSASVRFGNDVDFLDAVRAIPKLTEYDGPGLHNQIAYLLRQPLVQSFTRIGKSVLRGDARIKVERDKSDDPMKKKNDDPNRSLTPSILLASSRHSITELNIDIHASRTSFLSELIQLRVLRVSFHTFDSATLTYGIDGDLAEVAVNALSQCRLLERLDLYWCSLIDFTESHVERIVAPLVKLHYLVLRTCNHKIRSLDFLTRSVHLMNGLKYFSFNGRLDTLNSYRAIYALSQLRLLHLVTSAELNTFGLMKSVYHGDSSTVISPSSLDVMFRPHHQLDSTVPKPPAVTSSPFDFPAFGSNFGFASGGGGAAAVSGFSRFGTFGTPSTTFGVFGAGTPGVGEFRPSAAAPATEAVVENIVVGGQLPPAYLLHLRHFSQEEKNREEVREWMEFAAETEKAHDQEIMQA